MSDDAEQGKEKDLETTTAGTDDLGIKMEIDNPSGTAQPSVTDDPWTANAEHKEEEKEAKKTEEEQKEEEESVEKQNVEKPREKRRTQPSHFKKPPYTEGKAKNKNNAGAEAEVEKKRGGINLREEIQG